MPSTTDGTSAASPNVPSVTTAAVGAAVLPSVAADLLKYLRAKYVN